MRITVAMLFLALAQDKDEAVLRAAFARDFKAKEAAKRVEAVEKLAACTEEKTLEALVAALKDPDKAVRKAVADTIATCRDGAGLAIKPMCAALTDKKEDPPFRYACAKALAKASYRTEAVSAMIDTISGIENKDFHLHEFGRDVTIVLEGITGEHFNYAKNTPYLWQTWWKETKAKYEKADEAKRAELKKAK